MQLETPHGAPEPPPPAGCSSNAWTSVFVVDRGKWLWLALAHDQMKSRQVIIYVVLAFVVFNIALAWFALRPSPPATPVLPRPNGYDDFVKAGQMLVIDPDNFAEASVDELSAMVSSNAPALAALRGGLEKECRVPLQYTRDEGTNWVVDLPLFKQLAFALRAEAELNARQTNAAAAAEVSVEIIRFGAKSCQGGVLIHRLVGVAIQMIGSQHLEEIHPLLDAATSKRLIRQLEAALACREPLSTVQATEAEWSRRSFKLREWIGEVIQTRSLRPNAQMIASSISNCERLDGNINRLLLDIASRAYELETSEPPKSASDLVPEFLEAVPIDPVTGDSMELSPGV